MISDVPNFAYTIGYFSGHGTAWTRRADIAGKAHIFSQLSVSPCIIFFSPTVALYFSKLLNYMKKNNVAKVVPKFDPKLEIKCKPFDGGLTSGYWVRSAKVLPKQGDQYPWSGGINYFQDVKTLYFKSFDTTALDLTYHSK